MPSLYQVSESARAAIDEVMAMSEHVDEQAIKDTIEGITGDLQCKQANVAAYALNIISDIRAMKEYRDKMDERIKRAENKVKALKAALLWSFERNGYKPVVTHEISVTQRPCAPSVLINNESLLEEKYVRRTTTYQPNKAKIALDLKAGIAVAGASLIDDKKTVVIK